MKTNKKVKFFLKKHFYKIRILVILLGTLIMFHAYYFYDRPFTLETLIQDKGKPKMYICFLFSFGISIFISYLIGYFKKENVKKMTSMKEFEE